jgi:hypothetical protein
MTARSAAALAAAAAAYLLLVLSAAVTIGTNYEEVVPYVLTPLDIRDGMPRAQPDAPGFVVSDYLPRLALAPSPDVRLPLLNQLYMTDHLSYGGVALGSLGLDRLWAARLWHALFGLALILVLYDVARCLGLSQRAALIALAIAATSLHVTIAYATARFDESLASFGTVVVLWAALRYARTQRTGWVWIGVFAAAFAVSGKVTALWPLFALAVAGALAGWRPPPLRVLVLPMLAAAPLLAVMGGFALAGPAAGGEVQRRLAFFGNLFTSDVILGTLANLVVYLGSWGSITGQIIRGADAGAANRVGQLLVIGTIVWLAVRTLRSGPVPRRYRLEAQMLTFLVVIVVLVMFFFREHRDYQFLLLVPLYAVAMAAWLDACAQRLLDRRMPAWLAGVLVGALPVLGNLWEQRGLRIDLPYARNAMVDLAPQRAAADWLLEHQVRNPIVVTFYEVGIYELFTDAAVRPVYAFPLLRGPKDRSSVPDLAAVWRQLLADGETHHAVLPLGENSIERRHFDEPAIRQAMLQAADTERVAVINNRRGEPVLEVWTARTGAAPAGDAP